MPCYTDVRGCTAHPDAHFLDKVTIDLAQVVLHHVVQLCSHLNTCARPHSLPQHWKASTGPALVGQHACERDRAMKRRSSHAPVGPPPTMTKDSSCLRSSGGVSGREARSKQADTWRLRSCASSALLKKVVCCLTPCKHSIRFSIWQPARCANHLAFSLSQGVRHHAIQQDTVRLSSWHRIYS